MRALACSLSQCRGSRLKSAWCPGQAARTATAHRPQAGPCSCPGPSSLASLPSHAHTMREEWNQLRSAAITHQAPKKAQTKARIAITITHAYAPGNAAQGPETPAAPSVKVKTPTALKQSPISSGLLLQPPPHLPGGQRLD